MAKAREFRFFVPARKYVAGTNLRTAVYAWLWRRGHGLTVIFKDGSVMQSDWTLRELMSRPEEAREVPTFPIYQPTGQFIACAPHREPGGTPAEEHCATCQCKGPF